MRKAPTIFVLITALLWQTFAMAQAGFAQDHADGIAHVLLHLENDPHHHHDDGTFHQDDSDESVKHVYADGSTNTAGVVPAHITSAQPDVGARVDFSLPAPRHDSPVLEAPRRPPRFTA